MSKVTTRVFNAEMTRRIERFIDKYYACKDNNPAYVLPYLFSIFSYMWCTDIDSLTKKVTRHISDDSSIRVCRCERVWEKDEDFDELPF